MSANPTCPACGKKKSEHVHACVQAKDPKDYCEACGVAWCSHGPQLDRLVVADRVRCARCSAIYEPDRVVQACEKGLCHPPE
jgi:hypothetical protein